MTGSSGQFGLGYQTPCLQSQFERAGDVLAE
jgi:hypothetical protein